MSNVFLDKAWQQNHLKWIKQIAGPRYSPHLNIDLSISEIFDAISRNKNFYSKIQDCLKNITQAFSCFSKNNKDISEENILACQKNVELLQEKLKRFSKYNTNLVPWKEIQDQSFELNKVLDHVIDVIKLEIDSLQKSNQQDNSQSKMIAQNLRVARESLFDIRSYFSFFYGTYCYCLL